MSRIMNWRLEMFPIGHYLHFGEEADTKASTLANEGCWPCSFTRELQLTRPYPLIARGVGSGVDVIYSSNNRFS
jgi:hypothetical protein